MAGIADRLQEAFPFQPTQGQAELFGLLETFLADQKAQRPAFLLKGYAGTGKTTILLSLVRTLGQYGYKSLLLAPTGRAAKVMSAYTQRRAFTIHKIIFKQMEDPATGRIVFRRQPNKSQQTVFIVDEASMIDNRAEGEREGLLTDLINYVFEQPDSGNKLLLIGDMAQLPPVFQEMSPAFSLSGLQHEFQLTVSTHTLTEVMRQEEHSGILVNATKIRQAISRGKFELAIGTKGYKDIFRMNSEKLEDGLRYAYNKFGLENTVLITRSNRAATQYNQFIRRQIRFAEDEIEAGDVLMIVRNNYFWLSADSPAGFLANGEFAEVRKVRNIEEIHGFRFADLSLQLIDYPEQPSFEAKVHLKTLHDYTPQLSREETQLLFENVMKSYEAEETKGEQVQQARKDPYLNALQVKFAYALTCHKSQGGQWPVVFVDMGYLQEEMMEVSLLRWVYTALTRASEELFLVNFMPRFFKD